MLLKQNYPRWIFMQDVMTTHKSYQSYLIESLKDPAEAAAYLDDVSEDSNLEQIGIEKCRRSPKKSGR
jgi:hypothetical protein